MIQLLTYPANFGQFSLSPFCVKAAYLLAMSGQNWQREDLNDPRRMPKQKLPVIRVDGKLIAGSGNIRAHLEAQGTNFDPGLTDVDKAHSQAVIRMAEEHMYFHLVLDRWGNDAVWPTIRETYFHMIPGLLRKPVTNSLRRKLMAGLHTQGLGRLTPTERMARIEPDLQALSTMLWHSKFLFADHVTSADLSVASMLSGMRFTPVETVLQRRIAQDAVLSAYVDRVQANFPSVCA